MFRLQIDSSFLFGLKIEFRLKIIDAANYICTYFENEFFQIFLTDV